MRVQYQGRAYELDMSDIDVRHAIVIQGHTGLSVNAFADALNDEADEATGEITVAAVDKPGFLLALVGMYWLMLAQNGEHVPIGDVRFPVGEFADAVGDAVAAEGLAALEAEANKPEPETAPDPTRSPPGSAPSPEPSSPSPESTGGTGTPDG